MPPLTPKTGIGHPMSTKFRGLKARPYEFRKSDGSSREVIAIYAGGKGIGFMEYETARKFVDRVHDLCDAHDRGQREGD